LILGFGLVAATMLFFVFWFTLPSNKENRK
jgi:hypothetical protein